MVEMGVDSILVLEDNEISGIVTQDDVMKAIPEERDVSNPVKSTISKSLITVFFRKIFQREKI